MARDELQLVEWLRTQQRCDPRVALGIGDDMAVLALQRGFLLVASDMILDGVHFDSRRDSLAAIGRKALACNLSDCAAMAVRPLAATVSLALPRAMALEQVKEFFHGMFALADEFDLSIVGGDTTRWDHPLAIDVAITATTYDNIDPVTRFGTKPGDRLLVTGKLGGSMASGRHLSFTPRVREARQIAEALGIQLHAMMDISDGLSLDLWRLCQASGVGAVLNETELRAVIHQDVLLCGTGLQPLKPVSCGTGFQPVEPVSCGTGFQPVEPCGTGLQPVIPSALEHALSDGEDFELLLGVDPGADATMLNLLPVGEVTARGYQMRRIDGSLITLDPKGYTH